MNHKGDRQDSNGDKLRVSALHDHHQRINPVLRPKKKSRRQAGSKKL
jgi:hypothetical protein